MLEFFQNMQKLILLLIVSFLKFLLLGWKWLRPFLARVVIIMAATFVSVKAFFLEVTKSSTEKYPIIERYIINFCKNNPRTGAIALLLICLVIFFWFWMIRHAAKYEIFHKKLWVIITIILGPIGALLYYFLRKRKFENDTKKRNKVLMSFFTPMQKRNESVDKSS